MLRSLAAAVIATTLVACGRHDTEKRHVAVDDAGRTLSLARPPERMISLAPGITELVFAIGAERRLVGRTRWCDYPPEALEIASVGDGLEPNVEILVAREPDLVLFYAAAANEPAIGQLKGLGISTAAVRTDAIADLARAARLLGRITGNEERADSLVSNLDRELAALEASRPEGPVPSALILAWDNPPIIIGKASYLSEIVELAGARNVFADIDRPSMRVSIEAIVERDPDVVLVASDSALPNRVDRPEWRAVPAIRDRRFLLISGSEFSRPSFRVPDAVRKLREALAERRR